MKSKQAAKQDIDSTVENASSEAEDQQHREGTDPHHEDAAYEAEIVSEEAEPSDEAASEHTESDEQAESAGVKDAKDSQFAELTQQLLRTQADFDNFRRRTRQEKEDLQKYAAKKLLEQLLPVVDNFERALSSFSTDSEQSSELKSGIEMVHRQLLGVLEQQGVQPIDAVGKPFDPKVHEAVMQESVDGQEPGQVLAELQKGYTIHDKVLRPAMVKVTS